MYCDQCGIELPECDDNEPYLWRLVDEYLYCLNRLDET